MEVNVSALLYAVLNAAPVVEDAGGKQEGVGKSSTLFGRFEEHYEDSGK